MQVKMEARVAARKSSKKDKQKVKQEKATEEQKTTTIKEEKPSTDTSSAGPSKPTLPTVGPSTSKLATEKSLKRDKFDKLGAPEFKKAKQDYSVAEDPKASEVYKSLFTTHDTEKQQDRAHWVTYNPHYN